MKIVQFDALLMTKFLCSVEISVIYDFAMILVIKVAILARMSGAGSLISLVIIHSKMRQLYNFGLNKPATSDASYFKQFQAIYNVFI